MSDDVVMIGHKAGMSAQTSVQVIQALIDNHMKAIDGGRDWENKTFTWVPAHGNCPRCQSPLERTAPRLGMHWASGSVRCSSGYCTYKSSTMSHIANLMFPVQQMPEGAAPIYYRESDLSPPSYISDESAAVGADSIREAEDERILGELRERVGK
jgi:hypothetical protein